MVIFRENTHKTSNQLMNIFSSLKQKVHTIFFLSVCLNSFMRVCVSNDILKPMFYRTSIDFGSEFVKKRYQFFSHVGMGRPEFNKC